MLWTDGWEKDQLFNCDFGGQSMMAARHLRKDGFEVYNIIGGVYYYMKEKEQNKSEA